MRKTLKESKYYEIDSGGKIYRKSTSRTRWINITVEKGVQKTFDIKYLIANNLLDNPENKSKVIQIDGDETNFHPSNLEWSEALYGDYIFDKKTDHRIRVKISQMIPRCHNKKDRQYKSYGAKEITVYKKWREDTLEFLKWSKKNGYFKDAWLYRYDKSKGYNPKNCYWDAPHRVGKLSCEMIHNIDDMDLPIREISEKYQVTYERIRQIKQKKNSKCLEK